MSPQNFRKNKEFQPSAFSGPFLINHIECNTLEGVKITRAQANVMHSPTTEQILGKSYPLGAFRRYVKIHGRKMYGRKMYGRKMYGCKTIFPLD